MAYDKKFFERYSEYLEEPTVRKNHDWMFRCFARLVTVPHYHPITIDLGCGTGEFWYYGARSQLDYIGIDKENNLRGPHSDDFIQADYLVLDFGSELKAMTDRLPRQFSGPVTTFVSLFSAEIIQSAKDKYAFYERLFAAFPTLKYGLVSGFFYESKRDQEKVGETGGIESYQTIERPEDYISPTFTEMRVHMKTPSTMFGPDVVEVWKILVRREDQ